MASIFEQISNLDRPFVPVTIDFGGVPMNLQVKRPNALEADAIEAYYSENYAKLVIEKTEEGGELEQMRLVGKAVPREQLILNLVGTRKSEVDRRAFELSNFDIATELRAMSDMPDDEKAEYQARRQYELEAAVEKARAEIAADYEPRTDEELRELWAQYNVNIKALMDAQSARNAMFVYLTLHDLTGERLCPSPEAVREKLQASTIVTVAQTIEQALASAVKNDLPFVSSDDGEPNGQPSSANTSEVETTPSNRGGKRTRNRRKNSKRSTTPHGGTPPAKG